MLYDLLEEKYQKYNCLDFIENDPISVPHKFDGPENIEISGFLAATLAWGQRKTIIRNADRLIGLMGSDPYAFLMEAIEKDFEIFRDFKHRTFNGMDAEYFIRSLANIYRNYGGVKGIFHSAYLAENTIEAGLRKFRKYFLELPHEKRTEKHIADIDKGAAAKRLNMFLRWMIRKDDRGVDFGLWEEIPMSVLYVPLDVHTGTIARELGLLQRNQNDWKAVSELTTKLRTFDPVDPVKYDFALFGMGVDGELKR